MEQRHEPVVDVSAPRAPTRWDERRPSGPAPPPQGERSGFYLAIVVAIALPLLVIVTAVRSTMGLGFPLPDQRVELQTPPLEPVTEVAGASETTEPMTDDVGEVLAAPDAVTDESTVATTARGTVSSTVGPVVAGPVAPTVQPTPPSTSSSPVAPAVTAAAAPVASTTATSIPASTATSTTTTSTTSTTTTAAPESSTTTTPSNDPATFLQRLDIGELGDTFVRYRFAVDRATTYSVLLRSNGSVEATATGTAGAGELVRATFDGLTPGSDYTVQVVLDGSPEVTSSAVAIRTSGEVDAPAATPVEVLGLRLVEVGETRLALHYESNICANGSFTIVDSAGTVVGRNDGQAAGCTTRHLAIPGFWTPALQPGSTYTITVTVEADGRGRGGGNTASASAVVTTAGRTEG